MKPICVPEQTTVICSCGCGQEASATTTGRTPRRFIYGHYGRFLSRKSIGNRSMCSNGYVAVHVGKEHRLADKYGRAYEHRLVAEQKLGRPLKAGESVHHIDGDRTNNDPSNIEVCASYAEHAARHRTRTDLRKPNEPNPLIACACGCGETLLKFDEAGRPRKLIYAHWGQVEHLGHYAIRKEL